LLADGARVLSDGSVFLADGSVFLADGSVFLADGSVLLADGVTLLADGSVLLADGSPLLADGATIAWEFAELTPTVAAESGTLPGPHTLTACVIGVDVGCPGLPESPLHRVWLDWEAPGTGTVDHYVVYRVQGDTAGPGDVGVSTNVPGSDTFLLDTDELPDGINFTYVVEAVLADGTVTPRSNTRTITAVNDPPEAGTDPDLHLLADAYNAVQNTLLQVPHGSLPGVKGVLGNDATGADSIALAAVPTPVGGTATANGGTVNLNADGSFTYQPPVGFVGVDTFTYRANNGPWSDNPAVPLSTDSDPVTVTITVTQPATQFKFQRTDVWMSTSSANRKFDLKAEVLKNGVPVPGLYKILTNQVLGSGSTFNKAIYKQIGSFPTTLVNFTTSDTLSVRVSIKVSNSSPGGSNASGDIRLWYNIPTPPGNNSHLHAKRGGTDVKYYLIAPFTLQKNGSVAGPTQNIQAVVYKTGFTPLGTWSITGP
jgi:hypothetical protein